MSVNLTINLGDGKVEDYHLMGGADGGPEVIADERFHARTPLHGLTYTRAAVVPDAHFFPRLQGRAESSLWAGRPGT